MPFFKNAPPPNTLAPSVDAYAKLQRAIYDSNAITRSGAESMVHPNFPHAEREAKLVSEYIVDCYLSRYIDPPSIGDLTILDIGCGVGRMMAAFKEFAPKRIDGADLSAEMLKHAAADRRLAKSKFFLTSGAALDGVPSDEYDLIYSVLCFHHICMRQTRMQLFAEIFRCLKPGGYFWLEFKFFPGADKRRIPPNHAAWHENLTARSTNSGADVWITPDSLGEVFADFHVFFSDLHLTQISIRDNYCDYDPRETYQYPFDPFFIGGSKGQVLRHLIQPVPE